MGQSSSSPFFYLSFFFFFFIACVDYFMNSSLSKKVDEKERRKKEKKDKSRLLKWLHLLGLHRGGPWRMLLAAVLVAGDFVSHQTHCTQLLPPSPQAVCGAALQTATWNLSVFEIIPVFLRIKFNPDRCREPVYSSEPRSVVSPQPWGEQNEAQECTSEGSTSTHLLCCWSQQTGWAWPTGKLGVGMHLQFLRFSLLAGFLCMKSSDHSY